MSYLYHESNHPYVVLKWHGPKSGAYAMTKWCRHTFLLRLGPWGRSIRPVDGSVIKGIIGHPRY